VKAHADALLPFLSLTSIALAAVFGELQVLGVGRAQEGIQVRELLPSILMIASISMLYLVTIGGA
jgi:hypothetical protein